MAAQQPARTSPELRARLHSARANVGITPRPGALPAGVMASFNVARAIAGDDNAKVDQVRVQFGEGFNPNFAMWGPSA